MREGATRRILAIDDDPDILATLEWVLTQAAFEVTKSEGGESALEEARHQDFDVAITDLKMPGMTGIDTLRALKGIAPSLPVIVMTGFASEGTAAECERLGAFGFLTKPFALEELFSMIDRATAGTLAPCQRR